MPRDSSRGTADPAPALLQENALDEAEAALVQARRARPRDVRPLLSLAVLYRLEERFVDATEVVQEALALDPGDPDVLAAFGSLSLDLEEPEGAELALEYLRARRPNHAAVAALRQGVGRLRGRRPGPSAEASPGLDLPRPQTRVPRVWAADEIALLCGRGVEKWSPGSLGQGIGGSEEAVVHLTRRLARLGWRPTVYGDPREDAGDYDGVAFRPHEEFNPGDRFNLLVGWRNVALYDTRFEAARTYLWLHDVENPYRYPGKRLANITRIFVLSRFHRAGLPNVPKEKFLITGNGIDVGQIEELERTVIRRDPHRCIYASSYDRGLEHLLAIWGDVKRAVPRAELHIFYGWKVFDTLYRDDPERRAWKARMVRLMAQPGVYEHGRVGQDRILVETLRSGVWAYPVHFPEISCITAMKCQAAGAVPVVYGHAALKETVQFGHKLPVEGEELRGPALRDRYRRLLIAALRDPGWQEEVRREMVPWAREQFTWDKVARQWDEEFRRVGD